MKAGFMDLIVCHTPMSTGDKGTMSVAASEGD
jgi:hypothetical protein